MTNLNEAFSRLRQLNIPVPRPQRLPTSEEIEAVERVTAIALPDDLKRYFLEASDVFVGNLEPATITATGHTYFPEILESARAYGVPEELLPFCEDNADFYCIDPSGMVVYWSHNGTTDESWEDLATWIVEVWIEEN